MQKSYEKKGCISITTDYDICSQTVFISSVWTACTAAPAAYNFGPADTPFLIQNVVNLVPKQKHAFQLLYSPLLRNMTTSNPPLFASGHLDAGISAKHMLHSKQPQRSTKQDNKTQPRAKAFPPKSKCCSQPKVPSVQVQLAFCSWRSSKSPGYSPLNTMKRSDSLQIQPECPGTIGPHNRRGRASY